MSSSGVVFNWLPCAVVFVTSTHEDRRDIMTATAMFISEKEPLIVISVASGHLTEELISASGRFAAVVAGEGQKQLAIRVGSTSGQTADKFTRFDIPVDDRLIPAGAAAWFGCRVDNTFEITGYRVFVGRIEDQERFDAAPLIWRDGAFYKMKPL